MLFLIPLRLVEDMEMRSTGDLIAAANAAEDESDDFEKLKAEREKERLERQKQKFVRQISTAPGTENVAASTTIVPAVVTAAILTNPVVSNVPSATQTPTSTLPPTGVSVDLLNITEPVTQATQTQTETETEKD